MVQHGKQHTRWRAVASLAVYIWRGMDRRLDLINARASPTPCGTLCVYCVLLRTGMGQCYQEC